MKRLLIIAAFLFTSCLPSADTISYSFVRAADRVTPAVVQIEATAYVAPHAPILLRRRVPLNKCGYGSGTIVRSDGYILTCAHVITSGMGWTVTTHDGTEYTAKLVGYDSAADVALLKIDAKGLPCVRLGDSSKLHRGQWVFTVGSPLGLVDTVTTGVISHLDRHPYFEAPTLQFDAAINPGNSGGGLFTLDGKQVGITSAIITPTGAYSGISIAVPSNTARDVARKWGIDL